MPILDDIRDHDLIGPAIKKGELNIVRCQIESRFGTVPAWVQQRLEAMSWREVEDTAVRLLKANSLEELLGK